jgi:hypothetical protein
VFPAGEGEKKGWREATPEVLAPADLPAIMHSSAPHVNASQPLDVLIAVEFTIQKVLVRLLDRLLDPAVDLKL